MTDAPASPSPASSAAGTALLCAGAAAALFTLGCHVAWRAEPFDASHSGAVGAEDYGYAARYFEDHGFWRAGMKAPAIYLPGEDGWSKPYLHHPFASYAAVYAAYLGLGNDEAAMRWWSLFMEVLIFAGLWLLGHRACGRSGAGSVLGITAALPVMIEHGNMVDSFPMGVATSTLCAAAWFRARDQEGTPRLFGYGILGFLGGLTSWYGYFIVPALWLDLILARPPRPWRTAFMAGLPFGLALVVHAGWMTWALGGPGPMLVEVRWLLSVVSGADLPGHHPTGFDVEWLPGMTRFFLEGAGPIPLVLAGTGLLVAAAQAVRGRAGRLDRAALAMTVCGILPAAVFWSRACIHDFFVLAAAPGLGLLACRALAAGAWAARRLRAALPPRTPGALAVALLLAIVAESAARGVALHARLRQDANRRFGEDVSRMFAPRDVILLTAADYVRGARFYTHVPVLPVVVTPKALDWTLEQLRPARRQIRRLLVAGTTMNLEQLPWLAQLPFRPETGRIVEVAGRSWNVMDLDPHAVWK